MPNRDPPSEEPQWHRWLLPLLLLLAALLRLWSLDFGLPHTLARPDETEIVSRSLLFFAGDLNPHFFHYPSLYFYLVGSAFAGLAGGLAIAGQPLVQTFAETGVDPSPFLLVARVVTAVAGVGSVAALYLLGKALRDPPTGMAAALFLAVSPLHVRDSHFATTDVVLTLCVTLAALFVLRSYRSGRGQDFALAGALSGLAVSAKYVGLLMPGAITAAYLLRLEHLADLYPWRLARRVATDARPWLFTGSMLLAFLVTSPYALLDSDLFLTHFRFQLNHLSDGHGVELGIGGVYHLRNTLPLAVGWPVFLAALVGSVLALREQRREAITLLAFPVLFYASTFTSQTLFLRYMLPVVPFLCLFAGVAVAHLAAHLPARAPRFVVVPVALTLLVAEPLSRDVTMNRFLGLTDSRVLAATWLVESAESGSHTVYQTGVHWGHLELPNTPEHYQGLIESLSRPSITPRLQRGRDFRRRQMEARLDDARARGVGFQPVESEEMESGVRPDYIVVQESDLIQYSEVLPATRTLLAAEYEAVHHTAGVPLDGSGWYDQHDAFYLPFTGFDGVTRPGPDVTVYRRIAMP